METLLPITPENIEEPGNCDRIPLANLSLVRAILLLRPVGHSIFEYHFVRAMIALPNGEKIYIDRFGGFRTASADSTLTATGLQRLEGYLDDLVVYARTQEGLRHTFGWAVQATRDLIARTEGWPESDYGIGIGHKVGVGFWVGGYSASEGQGPLVVAVWHKDDFAELFNRSAPERFGGGKSFELLFDPETKTLIRQLWYQ